MSKEACPVGWVRRILRLFLCRWVTTHKKCPGYNIKQPDGEVPVMLELRGMQSNLSLPLIPGPHWPGMVAPDRVLSMDQIKTKLCTYAKLNCLK